MEVDVRLSRSGDQPWGFRLVGGVDSNTPLSIAKVQPSSPAEQAGLQNGDTVTSINGVDACSMTHQDSKIELASAGDSLQLGVVRGLYDLVLDDFEPLYEPIDQADFDQQSQPTEVPDNLDLTLTLPELGDSQHVIPLPDLVNGKEDSRSLTASPFVLPTKPYRPFSTEPLPEIPPLEEPIILNPQYCDEFGRLKDEEEFLPKTRFKLPISEQYDPDGTKQKMKLAAKGLIKDETVTNLVTTSTESDIKTSKAEIMKKDQEINDQVMKKQEVIFVEKMKKEIDLDKIEMTATSIVDESISKALTVAEEIKKEIDVELKESSVTEISKESSAIKESKTELSEVTSKTKEETSELNVQKQAVKEVTELVELIDKTTDEIIKKNEIKIEVQKIQSHETDSRVDNQQQSIQKQTVSNTSETVDSKISKIKEDFKESQILEQKDVQRNESVESKTKVDRKEIQETFGKTQTDVKGSRTEANYSTSKLLAEQRAYTIGLQTIPNIRGKVHSSSHYDLLLKIFFIHLTDVMVALSRFILAEPVLSKPVAQEAKRFTETKEENWNIVTESKVNETVSIDKTDTTIKNKKDFTKAVVQKEDVSEVTAVKEDVKRVVTPAKKERVVNKIIQKAHEIKEQDKHEKIVAKVEENKSFEEQIYDSKMTYVDETSQHEIKIRDLSGFKMAQMTQKKPEELMQKMESVITEFESHATNEDIETVRERRSKSRSRVATPIDMVQMEMSSQEMSELTSTSAMSSMMESRTTEQSESRCDTTDYESAKDAKTYIAIVQSHVYTNKDAIFSISETATSQSKEETVSSKAIESVETIQAEAGHIDVKSFKTTEKAVQAVVDTSSKMVCAEIESKVQVQDKSVQNSAETNQELQKIEDKLVKMKRDVVKQETAKVTVQEAKVEQKAIKKTHDVVIQEITEPVPDYQEMKSSFIQDYTVTEAKDEIVKQKQHHVIKETAALKEDAVEIKELLMPVIEQKEFADKKTAYVCEETSERKSFEATQEVSIKQKKVSVKEELVTPKQEPFPVKPIAVKEEKKEVVVAVKEDIVPVETIKEEKVIIQEAVVEVKQEKPIVTPVDMVKKEEVIVKEAKTEIKEDNQELVVKEEAVVEVEQEKQIVTPVDMVKKEEVIIKEAKTEIKEDNQELVVKEEAVVEVKQEKQIVTPVDMVKKEEVIVKEAKTEIKEDNQELVVKEIAKKKAYTAENVEKSAAIFKESVTKTDISVKQESVQETEVVKEETVTNIEKEGSTALKITKQEIVEQEKTSTTLDEQVDISMKKVEINQFESRSQTIQSKYVEQESTFDAKLDQESLFIAKSVDTKQSQMSIAKSVETSQQKMSRPLTLDLAQKKYETEISDESCISTPTPSTVPPTPLTDEYIFSLTTKLPKREGPPIPRDCTPSDDDEDPHIVKKGLMPQIDAKVETPIIFDPPLPTPPTSPHSPTSPRYTTTPRYVKPGLRGGADRPEYTSPKSPSSPRSPTTPRYVKPGLRGGADRPEYNKEEIKEIELKSSLLASAIDQTIKSIEEYKEEVGMKKETTPPSLETKTEENTQNGVMYNGFAKIIETKLFNTSPVSTNSVEGSNITKEQVHIEDMNHSDPIKSESDILTQTDTESIDVTSNFTAKLVCNGISANEIVEGAKQNDAIIMTTAEISKEKQDTQQENVAMSNGVEILDVKQVSQQEHVPRMEEKKQEEVVVEEVKRDPMEGYKPVSFDPDELNAQREKRRALGIQIPIMTPSQERELYKTPSGDLMGTHQGIVDGLEEAVVDAEVAKELGKPGITEEKIAELISGEAEMLREAHVMGLKRVLASHMQKDGDDSSVDFKKIKPIVESLKDSEVLKALNEEILRNAEEKKKQEEKKWTTFLQKPKRPVPRAKFGYYKNMTEEEEKVEPYRPKIVKQPKPKVAPDYIPKDFNTGLLPWEERALREPTPPPVEPEEPILIPEEAPEILEAVDPLPESEVPDLEDSGIPLPPPKEPTPPPEEPVEENQEGEELDIEAVVEEAEKIIEENIVEEMERGNVADQIMMSVQNMVDPNAPLEQQLAQMRAQLAALAQLPGVIQQSLELVTRQLSMLSQLESQNAAQSTQAMPEEPEPDMTPAAVEETEVSDNGQAPVEEITTPEEQPQPEPVEPSAPTLTPEEVERMTREEEMMLEEQRKMEKQKKELMEQARIEHESRQVKQRATPRVGKPKPVFGPATPAERPLVLPGGRKWRKPKDAYNEAFIAETLQAQAEIIAGKAKGLSYESDLLPYDERINFMKYEKPPVSLDHLKESDTYKLIHNMETSQPKRVEMLTPVIAEADYREKCRSITPCPQRLAQAQQVQP